MTVFASSHFDSLRRFCLTLLRDQICGHCAKGKSAILGPTVPRVRRGHGSNHVVLKRIGNGCEAVVGRPWVVVGYFVGGRSQ